MDDNAARYDIAFESRKERYGLEEYTDEQILQLAAERHQQLAQAAVVDESNGAARPSTITTQFRAIDGSEVDWTGLINIPAEPMYGFETFPIDDNNCYPNDDQPSFESNDPMTIDGPLILSEQTAFARSGFATEHSSPFAILQHNILHAEPFVGGFESLVMGILDPDSRNYAEADTKRLEPSTRKLLLGANRKYKFEDIYTPNKPPQRNTSGKHRPSALLGKRPRTEQNSDDRTFYGPSPPQKRVCLAETTELEEHTKASREPCVNCRIKQIKVC